jgi:hypothetical protein
MPRSKSKRTRWQVRPQPFEVNGDGGYRLYRVGDAVSSRSLHAALLDAFRIAVAL